MPDDLVELVTTTVAEIRWGREALDKPFVDWDNGLGARFAKKDLSQSNKIRAIGRAPGKLPAILRSPSDQVRHQVADSRKLPIPA